MAGPINIKKIIKKNRKINAKQLNEGLILTEKLRKLGVRGRGYRLISPFARKQVHTNESELDPRTIQLRHP